MRFGSWVLLAGALGLGGCQYVFGVEPRADAGESSADAEPVPTGWAMIRTGSGHTCAIDHAQHLWCWGRGVDGQLGDGTQRSRNLPGRVQAVGTDQWLAVALGTEHTCGIQSDRSTWCWGRNDHRQLGLNTPDTSSVPLVVPGGAGAAEVAAGTFQSCILDGEGDLICWGANAEYRLAQDNPARDYLPTRVGADSGWSEVALQAGYACGIRAGEVYCWGTIANAMHVTPTLIAGLNPPVADIDVGNDHVCARNEAGTLWCWGAGGQGQLGAGNTLPSDTPVPVPGTWSGLSVAASSTCATAGTRLSCWGTVEHGRIGLDDADDAPNVNTPTPVGVSIDWSAISTFERHLCGLDTSGQAWCAGLDGDGQIGDGDGGPRRTPTLVASGIDEVTVGGSFACSRSGVDVRCWGQGAGGRLGTGRARAERVPTPVLAPTPWTPSAIAAGLGAACALSGPEGVFCWGRDDDEVVGTSAAFAPAPLPRPGAPAWTTPLKVLSVANHACVIDTALAGFCWGNNTAGQVAAPPDSPQAAPVRVASNSMIARIAVGTSHTCYLAGTTLTCQGDNSDGQLGNAMSGPVAGVDARDGLDAGDGHTCAIGIEGVMSCWGRNRDGQAGAPPAASAAPTLLPMTWSAVAAGDNFTCGIERNASRLWCWGNDRHGQLGIDLPTDTWPTPQEVDAGQTWLTVAAGGETACGITLARDLYCWGNNEHGQIGDGSGWQAAMARVGGP